MIPDSQHRGLRPSNLFGIVAVIAMMGLNYYGWTQLKTRSVPAQVRAASALIGTKARSVVARSPQGGWRTLPFDSGEFVLYILAPDCEWCQRNAHNIRALAAQESAHYQFVGISLGAEDPAQYGRAQGLPFPLYSQPSGTSKEAYGMGGTPQMIVIRNGTIVANWIGALQGSREYEVDKFFGVQLPGLTDPDPVTAPAVTCADDNGDTYSPGKLLQVRGTRKRCGITGQWVDVN